MTEDDFFENNVLIPPDHPYVAKLRPSVWKQEWDGKWTVRWRDFHMVKQDREFDTEAEARRFARSLSLGPHYTYGDPEMVSESSEAWWALEEMDSNE